MKRTTFLAVAIAALLPVSAMAQLAIAPAYGTFSTSPGAVVFTSGTELVVLDLAADSGITATEVVPQGAGAIGYLSGSLWLIGMTSAAEVGGGDVFIFDSSTMTAGSPIGNFTDVRDLAVLDQGDRFDAIIADRANDTVHLITDVLGTATASEITPASIAGNVGIQGLIAVSDSLYFLYDELPDDGFGSDELVIVEGGDSSASTTRISWNGIGGAGAGLNTDELSVDFHNGLAVRQTDDSTISVYLSNFGAFSDNQVIEVTWTDSGNGFDFGAPTTSVLLTESALFDAIGDNNGDADDVAALANSRGVAIVPGASVAEDQLAIWVDDSDNGRTFIALYSFADESFSLFGGDALEVVLENADVSDWALR